MIPSAAAAAPAVRGIWIWALLPLVLLAALIAAIVRLEPAERLRPEGMPPVEQLKIERATLAADGIHLAVMNDGPDPVTIAQVTVDDAYWTFTAERTSLEHLGRTAIHVPYPWVVGEAHGQTDPNPTLRVRAGESVRLVLRNEDEGMTHDFAIPEWQAATRRVEGGEEAAVTFRAPAGPSAQTYRCRPHSAIMRGTILVE